MRGVKTGLLFCIIFSSFLFSKTEKLTVIVKDLDITFSSDKNISQAITQKIRRRFLESGLFSIIEQKEIEKVLKKQKFQIESPCVDESCMIETGKFIGVDFVIYGAVVNTGKFITIVLRVLDITREHKLCVINQDIDSDVVKDVSKFSQGLAEKLIRSVAEKLKLNILPDVKKDKEKVVKKKKLAVVDSVKADSTVVKAKAVDSLVSKDKPVESDIEKKETVHKKIKDPAYITVKAKPEKALIIINEKYVDKGSVDKYEVPSGNASVEIAAPGFYNFRKNYMLKKGEKKIVEEELISMFGGLEVVSKPKRVALFLNKKEIAKTPFTNDKMRPGEYTLQLRADTYNDVIDSISIEKGKFIKKEYVLKHLKAYSDSVRHARFTNNGCRAIRRLAFGGLAVIFGAVGEWFNYQASEFEGDAEDAYSKYKALDKVKGSSEYDKDKSEDLKSIWYADRDENHTNCTRRDVCWGIGGVCALGFTISIFF